MMTSDNVMNLIVPTADLVTTAGITPDELTAGQVAIFNATGTIQDATTIAAAGRASTFYIYEGVGVGIAPIKTFKIEKGNIVKFSKVAGSAATQQTTTIDLTGYTPIAGNEIILKIHFLNDQELYTQQSNFLLVQDVVVAGDTVDTIGTRLTAQINALNFSKDTLVASYDAPTDVITITGVAFTNFDPLIFEYERSIFGIYLTGAPGAVIATTVAGSNGVGTYEQLAQLEEFVQGFDGSTLANRVHFGPVGKGNRGRITPGAPYLQYVLTGFNNDSEANYAISGKFPSKYELVIATRATATNLELALEALAGATV